MWQASECFISETRPHTLHCKREASGQLCDSQDTGAFLSITSIQLQFELSGKLNMSVVQSVSGYKSEVGEHFATEVCGDLSDV